MIAYAMLLMNVWYLIDEVVMSNVLLAEPGPIGRHVTT